MPEPTDSTSSDIYVTQHLPLGDDVTAAGTHVPMEVMSLLSDDKKRPLSVGSVSSSSSSSLPRHQRKKLATCVTSSCTNTGAQCNESIEEDDDVSCDDLDDVTSATQLCDVMNGHVANDDDEDATPTSSPHQERHSREASSDSSEKTSDDVSIGVQTNSTSPRNYVALCAAHARGPRTTQPSVANARSDVTEQAAHNTPPPLQLPPPSSPPPVPPPTPTSKTWPSQIVKGVQEILSTERTYVRDLQDIVQVR